MDNVQNINIHDSLLNIKYRKNITLTENCLFLGLGLHIRITV
jgi:hypothetical protein